jgi:iron-sulfur cluster repair protein YtfE (RIC family)
MLQQQQQQNKKTHACTTSSQSNTISIILECFHDTLRDNNFLTKAIAK